MNLILKNGLTFNWIFFSLFDFCLFAFHFWTSASDSCLFDSFLVFGIDSFLPSKSLRVRVIGAFVKWDEFVWDDDDGMLV